MCCNRSLNHKISRLHNRRIRIIYSDKKSSFYELLDKDEFVSIHHIYSKYSEIRHRNVQSS